MFTLQKNIINMETQLIKFLTMNQNVDKPGPEKEVPLTFHQEKKRPTHGPVEGEKEKRW
jgi:hypothetical protein